MYLYCYYAVQKNLVCISTDFNKIKLNTHTRTYTHILCRYDCKYVNYNVYFFSIKANGTLQINMVCWSQAGVSCLLNQTLWERILIAHRVTQLSNNRAVLSAHQLPIICVSHRHTRKQSWLKTCLMTDFFRKKRGFSLWVIQHIS